MEIQVKGHPRIDERKAPENGDMPPTCIRNSSEDDRTGFRLVRVWDSLNSTPVLKLSSDVRSNDHMKLRRCQLSNIVMEIRHVY